MPTRDEVADMVFEQVSKAFKVPRESLGPETNFLDDLKATSINYIPIMVALEDEYDIEFQYQEVRSKCRTIQGMIDHVMELIW